MAYRIKRYTEADRESLLMLWNELLKKADSRDIKAMYSESSCCASYAWLLYCDSSEQPVGSISIFQKIIEINGHAVRIGFNYDIIMLKKHRTLGPALQLIKKTISEASTLGYQFIIAFPNQMSQPVFKRAGYNKIGTAVRWSKILKSEAKLVPFIGNKFLRKFLSQIIDILLPIISYTVWDRFRYWNSWLNMSATIMKFEQFENEYKSSLSEVGNCNPEHLTWRYGKAGSNASELMVWQQRNEKTIIGYIVYYIDNGDVIVETMNFSKKKSRYSIILSHFADTMKKYGCNSIQISHWGSIEYKKLLKRNGFIARDGRDVYACIIDNPYDYVTCLEKVIDFFDGDLDF